MDRFTELQAFARIAEEGSLTRAAELLGVPVSRVSRRLTSLEKRLGVRLVQRTTRQLSLTSEGQRFAQSAREILSTMDQAEAHVSVGAAEPTGTLRIGSSLSFALLHQMPAIEDFKAKYTQVRFDLHLADRHHDIVEKGLDLAVRTRAVELDSSVKIRKLAQVPRLLAAAPEYLSKRGVPVDPDDLSHHSLLLCTLADDWDHLSFTRNGLTKRTSVSGAMISNDGLLLRQAALGGMGIVVQPAYILHEELRSGRLVNIMSDWRLPRLTMNLVFPTRIHLPARTRLFIDALLDYFREQDLEQSWFQWLRDPSLT